KKIKPVRQMPTIFKKISHWYNNHPHKKVILGGIVGGIITLLAMFAGWMVLAHQLEISVQLTEKVIQKDVEIIIDPTVAKSNPEKQILKGSLEKLEVTGSETIDTTGVTLVGERSKGTVTLLNKTTASKIFAAGTSLSTGSLTFSLDEEVTVASASDQGDSLDYGQVDIAVTADEIGADGNLSEGTELTVSNFSTDTYLAKAKSGFNGGSSREVRVAATEDRTEVLSLLKDKLIDEASKQFEQKSGNGTYYAPTSKTKTIEANYSAAAGDETDRLTLDLTLEVVGVSYLSDDLRPLWEAALSEDIPEGYSLMAENPEFLSEIRPEATASSRVILDVAVTAKARPPFDQQAIKENILGLSLRELIGHLTERPEIESASFQLKPGIAKFLVRKTPTTADRINIIVSNQAK
ncbi:MAG: hypothetical protein ABII10_02870, partial [Candidatus Paceibacterota bacterium]